MATIESLTFTKDWTNPSDFPTTEPDEARARADMQQLFNETRDFINTKLIPAIPDGVQQGDMNVRGYRITSVGDPVAETDAVNKKYVDAQAKSIRTTSIISTSWSGSAAPYTQAIPVTGVEANSIVEVSLRSTATTDQAKAYNALLLHDGGQTSGQITLRCFGTKNTISIPINIIVRRD